MQIGRGVSPPSPLGGARSWLRGRAEEPQAPRAAAPRAGPLPLQVQAFPPPRKVNLLVMSNSDLERHLTGLFGRRGYTVWPVPSRGEVGAALLICRGDQGVAVQVKRWNAPLGPEVVRAVLAAVTHHAGTLGRLGCTQIGGMVVATAPFTPETRELAAESGVLLWDRQELETQLEADLAQSGGGGARPAPHGR
ncbi:MAG: restriction endonuclease [Candidatus Dormibacteria bacterium]